MKHVFCIHSPITYLVMQSVIKYKRIPTKNVIVFISRQYAFDWSQYNHLHLSAPELICNSNKNKFSRLFQYLLFSGTVLIWSFKIFKAIGYQRGELYIPHTSFHAWNLLSTPVLFRAFNYIEEGVLYYGKNRNRIINEKISLKQKIPYLGFLNKRVTFSNKAKYSYVFSKDVLKEIPNPIILDLKNNINQIANKDDKKEIIIAIDGVSAGNQILTLEQNLLIINDLCRYIKKNLENISVTYKLHPNQYNSIIEASTFQKLLRSYFLDVKELPSDTILESYLGNKNKIIFTGLSSISFYAFLLDYPIKSFIFKYSEYNNRFSYEALKQNYSQEYVDFLLSNAYDIPVQNQK